MILARENQSTERKTRPKPRYFTTYLWRPDRTKKLFLSSWKIRWRRNKMKKSYFVTHS